ncbi:MAG: ATP-binding cassette domain-containing protein, partial [Christensenellaceae bacterium]
ITHKLNEVMSISDRVAVLRKGEHIATVETAKTNEQELTEMMVGKKVSLNIDRPMPVNCQKRLEVRNLTFINNEGIRILDDVNFDAFSGEILGIAGIAGSGQRELLESIAGLQIPIAGASIEYYPPEESQTEESGQESKGENVGEMPAGEQLIGKSPLQIREMGIRLSFVPEDRLGMGLVGNMDIIDNMMLRSYRKGHSIFLDRKEPENLAEKIIKSLEVSTPSAKTPVRRLSGGNVQKVLVGREIAASPTVLLAAYPVRGLDINSSYTIYNLLTEQKKKGVCVIFVGEDLDVLLELCDRIMVIGSGRITGILDGRTAKKEEIGLLMVKNQREEREDYEE